MLEAGELGSLGVSEMVQPRSAKHDINSPERESEAQAGGTEGLSSYLYILAWDAADGDWPGGLQACARL